MEGARSQHGANMPLCTVSPTSSDDANPTESPKLEHIETAYHDVPLLQSDNASIRVLRLLPEKHGVHLACEVIVIAVQSGTSYKAVSYVWGEAAHSHTIVVNGAPLDVGKNIWHFLDQMHQESEWGYLWIDAICIDQLNIGERNHQVAIMGKIYSEASSVVVWLGQETNLSQRKALSTATELTDNTGSFTQKLFLDLSSCMQALADNDYWTRICPGAKTRDEMRSSFSKRANFQSAV
jgi:hypothetical protein